MSAVSWRGPFDLPRPPLSAPVVTLLCIEPNDLDVLLLEEVCAARGFALRVRHAATARCALALLECERADLALLSVLVPDAEWAALTRTLTDRGLDVWVWDGRGRDEDGAVAAGAGASAYLKKPRDLEGYAALLEGVVQRSAARHAR